MVKYENTMKDILFSKEREINEKEKENFKLREENIEVEKLYLKQREETQRREEKYFKALTKLKSDLDAYRKDLENIRAYFERSLTMEKNKMGEDYKKIDAEIKRI